jgi:cell division septum initiation protein DivIVA
MTWPNLVGLVPVVLLVILASATVVAYFRASLAKATIDTLKESNGALTEQVAIVKDEAAQLATRVALLERENEQLRAAPRVAFDQLLGAIETHHAEILADRHEFAQQWTAAMTNIGSKLDSNRHGINDVLALVGDARKAQDDE